MLCRPLGYGTLICVALILLAGWDSRAHAQGFTGGSAGSTGSSSAPGGGFTGGGGSSGGGFTGGGGSSGGGFTGGGSSPGGGFTGGGSASGGGTSLIGGLGGTSTGAGGTTTTPSAVNPFVSTYVNPYGAGLISVTGQQTVNKPFGQAMYNVYSTATQSTTSTSSTNQGYGFNTVGMGRTPYYTATLSDDVPRVVHSNPQLQADVTGVLRRMTSVQPTTPLRVRTEKSTVYIDGTVASAKQKRLVENMIRLTPGVRDVVNNIEISEALPAPKTAPQPMGP